MFFIEGQLGRGKTFLINALTAILHVKGNIILIVGTSALSAIAYPHGQTAHYLFGIPVTDNNVDLHSTIPIHCQVQLYSRTNSRTPELQAAVGLGFSVCAAPCLEF